MAPSRRFDAIVGIGRTQSAVEVAVERSISLRFALIDCLIISTLTWALFGDVIAIAIVVFGPVVHLASRVYDCASSAYERAPAAQDARASLICID